jgi:hypothetical protein
LVKKEYFSSPGHEFSVDFPIFDKTTLSNGAKVEISNVVYGASLCVFIGTQELIAFRPQKFISLYFGFLRIVEKDPGGNCVNERI